METGNLANGILWNYPPVVRSQKLISERPEGNIYLINNEIILKEYLTDGHLLEYEYQVGCQLNKLNHPNLIKTYFYSQEGSIGRLYLEYAEGQLLQSIMETIDRKDYLLLLKHIIYILLDIQSQIKFTHYDLHPQNVLVRITEPRIYEYQNGKFESPFQIKIIDYGTSHVPGINVRTHRSQPGLILNGIIPEIFDPLYDIIYVSLYFNESEEYLRSSTLNKIKENRFKIGTDETFRYHEFLSEVDISLIYFIDEVPYIKYYTDRPKSYIVRRLQELDFQTLPGIMIPGMNDAGEIYNLKKSDSHWMYRLHLHLYELMSLIVAFKNQNVITRPYPQIVRDILTDLKN